VSINKTTWCLIFIIVAQFGASIFPEMRQATWSLNILAFLLLPYRYLFGLRSQFANQFGYLYLLLLAVNLSLIVRGLLMPNGQTLQSIIGNPVFISFHALPLFALLATSDRIVNVIYKTFKYIIVISLFVGLIFKSISLSNSCVYFFIVFFPYIKLRRTKYFYSSLVVFLGLMVSLMLGMRMVFMAVLFFTGSIYLLKTSSSLERLRSKTSLISFILIFTPFSMFMIAVTTGYSIFNISNEFQFLSDSDQGSTDTRTFVWEETLLDIIDNDAIIFGKGMAGTIKTRLPSFVDATIKNGKRLFVESAFLEHFRRGGFVFALLNFIVLVWAVWNASRKSQNNFLLLAAMSLTFFFMLSFIGHIAMLSHEYIIFWILIGLCLSKKWNRYTDEQIYELMHTGKLIEKNGN